MPRRSCRGNKACPVPASFRESINGIIPGGTLDKAVHYLEEGLAQIGRAFLCGRHTFTDVLSGFIFSGVNTGKGGQRPAVRETCFNLRKTNAANESWLADFSARPIALLILTA